MMRHLFLFLLCMLTTSLWARENSKWVNFKPKVFYSSADVMIPPPSDSVKNCRLAWPNGNFVFVKHKNGAVAKVAADSIWGYHPKTDDPVRLYGGEPYRFNYVTAVGGKQLVLYWRSGFRSSSQYFSLGLDSPIYSLDRTTFKEKLGDEDYKKAIGDRRIKWSLFGPMPVR